MSGGCVKDGGVSWTTPRGPQGIVGLLTLVSWAMVLSGCAALSIFPSIAATQTQSAFEREVGTAVALTEIVLHPEWTRIALSATPTPGFLPLQRVILTTPELNSILPIWESPPQDLTTDLEADRCYVDCLLYRWRGAGGAAELQIRFTTFTSRDAAVTRLMDQRQVFGREGLNELPVAAIRNASSMDWIIDARPIARGLIYHHREGRLLVEIALIDASLDVEQMLLYLNAYTEKQLERLQGSGY